jgi:hypothetical protein
VAARDRTLAGDPGDAGAAVDAGTLRDAGRPVQGVTVGDFTGVNAPPEATVPRRVRDALGWSLA